MTAAEPQPFVIRQAQDADGVLRLGLLGELDLAAAGRLETRLAQLRRAGCPVRLDLSQLSFIDCRGLRIALDAVADAERSGWQLEVDATVSASVRRLIALTGTGPCLWPDGRSSGSSERPTVTDALLTRVRRLLQARRLTDRADARRLTLSGASRGR